MTDKELRKMSRKELLELLVSQSRENDQLRERLERTEKALSDRMFQINQAGSIAEAALQVNEVFVAAQRAADQYLENIQALSQRQDTICQQTEAECMRKANAMLAEAERRCQALEAKTAKYCDSMIREAQQTFTLMYDTANNPPEENKPDESQE